MNVIYDFAREKLEYDHDIGQRVPKCYKQDLKVKISHHKVNQHGNAACFI